MADEAKSGRSNVVEKWDGVLDDLKIFSQLRETKWMVEKPEEVSFFKKLPVELLHAMSKE